MKRLPIRTAAAAAFILTVSLAAPKSQAQTPEERDHILTAQWEAAQPDVRTLPHIASRKPFRRYLDFWDQRAFPLGYIPQGALEKTNEDISTWRTRRDPRDAPSTGWGPPGLMDGWISAGPAPINGAQTSDNGNVSGRIAALAVAPGHPNTWYAGAAMGGLWRTTDAGATWSALGDANASTAQNTEYTYVFSDTRRSVYTPAFRAKRLELFEVFDFGNVNQTLGQRNVSTVAPQALFLLNSPFVMEQAKLAAERSLANPKLDEAARLDLAYRTALGRLPTKAERETVMRFLGTVGGDSGDDA